MIMLTREKQRGKSHLALKISGTSPRSFGGEGSRLDLASMLAHMLGIYETIYLLQGTFGVCPGSTKICMSDE